MIKTFDNCVISKADVWAISFSFSPIDFDFDAFCFLFFMCLARFQIVICEPQSIWRKVLVLSLLFTLVKRLGPFISSRVTKKADQNRFLLVVLAFKFEKRRCSQFWSIGHLVF